MASSLPNSMKAIHYNTVSGGFLKNLKYDDVGLPKKAKALPADHTLVKVAYSTVNPADYKLPDIPLVGRLMPKPAIPGVDFSGTVVESKLPHLKAGTRVYGTTALPAFGALAEYLVVGKETIAPIPDGLSLEDAAAAGVVGLTAYQTLVPFLKSGDKVLINGGSGGVGTFAIQIAKVIGCTVTTTCSGPNVDLCKSLGADEVIDYRTNNVVETLKRSGKQFDHIFDTVFADQNLYWQSHHYLKKGGKFVTISGDLSLAFIRFFTALYLWPAFLGGGQRPFQFISMAPKPGEYEQLAGWMKEKKVKAIIEQVYDLQDTTKAFEKLKTGRTRGKLVIKVAGG